MGACSCTLTPRNAYHSQTDDSYPVATVAYIAAKAADQRSFPLGVDLYAAERAWQAAWLRDRLHLTVGA